ncbi:hypothetical protein HDU98_011141 [Podochytrium sp. JEL0797]|nr:hypothetical protein HDU98_011141 [Podochytrium sp. JEL0797]
MQFANENDALTTLRHNHGKGDNAELLAALARRSLPSSFGFALDARTVGCVLNAALLAWRSVEAAQSVPCLDLLLSLLVAVRRNAPQWGLSKECGAALCRAMANKVLKHATPKNLVAIVKATATHLFKNEDAFDSLLFTDLLAAIQRHFAQNAPIPQRFFIIAKLFVPLNSILLNASHPLPEKACTALACFLLSATLQAFTNNIQTEPDFKSVFSLGINHILHSLLDRAGESNPSHKLVFVTNLLSADELSCGHPVLDIDTTSVSQDQLAVAVIYLVSLTLSVSSTIAPEMLVHSPTQQQPFACFLNIIDSLNPQSLLMPYESSTLYVHLVASMVVFAECSVPAEMWVDGFERALFEAVVGMENLVAKLLVLEVFVVLSDEGKHCFWGNPTGGKEAPISLTQPIQKKHAHTQFTTKF